MTAKLNPIESRLRKNPLILFLHPQNGEKRLLRYLDRSDLLHALLAGFLLLQQLALASDVAAVALGKDVLAQGLHGLARDDLRSDRRLHRNVEHLPRYELAHAHRQLAAAMLRVFAVHDQRQGVDALAVDEDVEADHVRRAILEEIVVERSIPARD